MHKRLNRWIERTFQPPFRHATFMVKFAVMTKIVLLKALLISNNFPFMIILQKVASGRQLSYLFVISYLLARVVMASKIRLIGEH